MCETSALSDGFSTNIFFYEIRVHNFMWLKFVSFHHANIKRGEFRGALSPFNARVCSLFQVMKPQTNFD